MCEPSRGAFLHNGRSASASLSTAAITFCASNTWRRSSSLNSSIELLSRSTVNSTSCDA